MVRKVYKVHYRLVPKDGKSGAIPVYAESLAEAQEAAERILCTSLKMLAMDSQMSAEVVAIEEE